MLFVIVGQQPVQTVAADQPQPVAEAPVQNAVAEADPAPDQQVAADESTADDVVEGSGGGDIPAVASAPVAGTGFFSSLPSLPSFQSLFARRAFSYRQSRQFFSQCNDRITMPCIVEGSRRVVSVISFRKFSNYLLSDSRQISLLLVWEMFPIALQSIAEIRCVLLVCYHVVSNLQ